MPVGWLVASSLARTERVINGWCLPEGRHQAGSFPDLTFVKALHGVCLDLSKAMGLSTCLRYPRCGSMHCRLFIVALAALAFAAPASASTTLWPGVTFEPGLQLTEHGPVAINVLVGPRPGGTTTLAPVLSGETLGGRETLTSIQRRLSSTATTAGVNGDFFSFDSGVPSGILVRDTQVVSPPNRDRSSAGVLTDGTLDIRKVEFYGTWRGAGPARTLTTYNALPPANGSSLFTSAWGARRPRCPDRLP